jgi:hypothetical protein
MNIIIKPHGSSSCYCRPDTTWERENKDFYVPENVCTMYWAPILFARISKAGKCINPKFASRYYDAFSFGMLMYTDEKEMAFSSCADHTSLLPFPLYNNVVMEGEDNEYKVFKCGEQIFNARADRNLLEEAICKASERTSVRIGDFVAVELDELKPLAGREEGKTGIKASFCGNDLYEFQLIF